MPRDVRDASAFLPSHESTPTSDCDSSTTTSAIAALPALERDHVQRVYDAVAEQWHSTRYKAWPRVIEFVQALPAHSLVADLGCGNGKIAPHCREAKHHAVGCDFSAELVRIAALQQGLDAQTADVMALPYRDAVFDAALSIAVLHHVSTVERRRLLVAETLRVLRPGGKALFYAWASEQSDGRSGHQFDSSDVFVPFHNRLPGKVKPQGPKAARAANAGGSSDGKQRGADSQRNTASATASIASDGSSSGRGNSSSGGGDGGGDRGADGGAGGGGAGSAVAKQEAMGGIFDPSKRAVVFQRYCHVYSAGELKLLVEEVGGTSVLEEYEDTGNHCLVVQKDLPSAPGDAPAVTVS